MEALVVLEVVKQAGGGWAGDTRVGILRLIKLLLLLLVVVYRVVDACGTLESTEQLVLGVSIEVRR